MCAPLAVVTLLLLRLLLRVLLVLLCLLLLLLLSLGIRARASWILRSVRPAAAWLADRPNVLVSRRRSWCGSARSQFLAAVRKVAAIAEGALAVLLPFQTQPCLVVARPAHGTSRLTTALMSSDMPSTAPAKCRRDRTACCGAKHTCPAGRLRRPPRPPRRTHHARAAGPRPLLPAQPSQPTAERRPGRPQAPLTLLPGQHTSARHCPPRRNRPAAPAPKLLHGPQQGPPGPTRSRADSGSDARPATAAIRRWERLWGPGRVRRAWSRFVPSRLSAPIFFPSLLSFARPNQTRQTTLLALLPPN